MRAASRPTDEHFPACSRVHHSSHTANGSSITLCMSKSLADIPVISIKCKHKTLTFILRFQTISSPATGKHTLASTSRFKRP